MGAIYWLTFPARLEGIKGRKHLGLVWGCMSLAHAESNTEYILNKRFVSINLLSKYSLSLLCVHVVLNSFLV